MSSEDRKSYSERLQQVIPGGAHTYSRGDDQYPSNAPQILERGEGAYVYAPGGQKFLDYGMALRAVTVGYGYKPIADAAYEQILKGNNLTRASSIELEAAELLCETIPSAEMVKFAKNGSTVTTAALKIARAYTGRKYVAVCSDHPFFSFDDWFIGTTPIKRGIPTEHSSLTKLFRYNDLESLERVFAESPGQIAAVMLEPATTKEPVNHFLHKVRDLCRKNGAVFILDEMITGFRFDLAGAQKYFDIDCDLCTFGKGMANGFSVAALAGKREIMKLGGISEEGSERIFLISTTHGAEMCGLGAYVKTMSVYKELDVVKHLWTYGDKLITGMRSIAKELGLEAEFVVEGYACSPNYLTKDRSGKISLELRTLFSQEMIRQGVLMPWIALAYAHGESELQQTLEATRKALLVYRDALDKGVEKFLIGRAIRPVFRQYN